MIEDAEKVIDLAKTDEETAIQMSNDLIEKIMNAQQDASLDGHSAALHSHQ